MKHFILLLCCTFNLCFISSLQAVSTAPPTTETEINASPTHADSPLTTREIKKQEKKEKRLAKWSDWAENKLKAYDIDVDLDDPVKKWLWLGLFGLAISVALSLIATLISSGLFYRLSYVVGVVGIACLIIWLIKYLE